MITYLEGKDLTRPTRVTTPPADPRVAAQVDPGFERGTLTLSRSGGGVAAKGSFTLVWAAGQVSAVRGIPPGTYRVRTVRVERAKGDDAWFISSTIGARGPAVEFEKDKTTHVAFDARVHVKAGAIRRRGALNLQLQIKDADGHGLTVYENAKRVGVSYVVFDGDGRQLAAGTMGYG